MTRRTSVLAVFVILFGATLGCAQHVRTPLPTTPSPQAAVAEATRLDALVEKLYGERKLQEATSFAERSLGLRERALGPRTPDVADSLNNLAVLYQAQGAYAKAEPLYIRAIDINEKAPRPHHLAVARSLNNLAELYLQQGVYAKAEPLLIRALEIREKLLGAKHPDVAEVLNNLAACLQKQGTYAKAEALYIRAIGIFENVLGAADPKVANCLGNLALLYVAQGAYAKAEPLLVRALDIHEKALGAMHPDVAFSLNSLAGLYQARGAYAKAEALFIRALDIRERALGAMHPEVGNSLNNLAMLYDAQGAYAKAEPLLVRALGILEKTLGGMHPEVAQSLSNLAMIRQAQGAYTKAESLLVRALDILEKTQGMRHPDVATSLHNLAIVYQAQGAYSKAEPLALRALDIYENTLGAMHPDVAIALDNLAEIYRKQGAYAKAEPLLVRALDIKKNALGAMHPEVATSLNGLAILYQVQGAYAKAEPLYLRALDIRERILGAMHPDVATSVNNLALFYQAQGAYAKVAPLMARAAEIQEVQLHLDLARLSAPRKRALMMLLQKETDSVVSLHADATLSSPQTLELALATVLRRKGRELDSLVDNQLTLRAHLTPALRDKLDQLTAASTELSTYLRAPFDPRTAASRADAITTLRTRIDEIESTLNEASTDFRAQSEPITIAKIQAALPRGAALVEFVRYHRVDPREAKPWQEERYVVYVLPWQGPPKSIALGEAAPIDAGVSAMLAAMHKGTSADVANVALQHLDRLVFAPLRGPLTGISHVILSPDGTLNLVPFEALVDAQGHSELEQRLMSYVTSGRDLLRLSARRAPQSPPTIVAAPDYGPSHSPALNGVGTFRPLAGAVAEAAELPAYFVEARTLTRSQATKAALAATIGPAVLHIATHGFYTPEAPPTSIGSTTSVSTSSKLSTPQDRPRGMDPDGDANASLPPPPLAEDPSKALDQAGLALAGANVGPEGIVSARELATYDWWGTQLVVLSACETGVGAVTSGEGVYGIRRALVLAGTESQVVSLWNVNDTSTRELMRTFYGELARGTGRAEALRRAKLRLLRQPQFAHPYYWAAFISAGDWTPLDPHVLKQKEHGK